VAVDYDSSARPRALSDFLSKTKAAHRIAAVPASVVVGFFGACETVPEAARYKERACY